MTLKIVGISSLNWKTIKKQIKGASKRSLNVPYLRKVQFTLAVRIFSIFPHSDWIRTDTRKNAYQNNSEYGLFLRSDRQGTEGC